LLPRKIVFSQNCPLTNCYPNLWLHFLHQVHRIGRTGRCGRTGLATTFVNQTCTETILLDLRQLLIESRQKVPAFLQSLQTPEWEEVASMCNNAYDTFLKSITSFGIWYLFKFAYSQLSVLYLQTKRAFVDVPTAVAWDIVLQIVQS
jgi:hypothetical protein